MRLLILTIVLLAVTGCATTIQKMTKCRQLCSRDVESYNDDDVQCTCKANE